MIVFIAQVILLTWIMGYYTIIGVYPESARPSSFQLKRYVMAAFCITVLMIPEIIRIDLLPGSNNVTSSIGYLIITLALASVPILHYHHRYLFNPYIGYQFSLYWLIVTVFIAYRTYLLISSQHIEPTSLSMSIISSAILGYNIIAIVLMMALRDNTQYLWLYLSIGTRCMRVNFAICLWWLIIFLMEKQIIHMMGGGHG